MTEPIGKAATHAPDQCAEFGSRPAIAAIQNELDRSSLIQEPAEGLLFAPREISIQNKQHQLCLEGNIEGETGMVAAVDFIQSRGVDQLDPSQARNGCWPIHPMVMPGAAVEHIRGHYRPADQSIDQAGFAGAHPTADGDAEMTLLQSRQLLINLQTLRIEAALFP